MRDSAAPFATETHESRAAREEAVAILAAAMEFKQTQPTRGVADCISIVERAFDDLLQRRIAAKAAQMTLTPV